MCYCVHAYHKGNYLGHEFLIHVLYKVIKLLRITLHLKLQKVPRDDFLDWVQEAILAAGSLSTIGYKFLSVVFFKFSDSRSKILLNMKG